MSTRTRQAARGTAGGRFARSGATPRRRPATAGRVVPRPPIHLGRRPPQKSTPAKLLASVTALLPGSRTTSSSGSSAKGKAGFAALAGAAAVAFKNRDKLSGLIRRNQSGETGTPPVTHPSTVAPGEEPPAA
jgi:hypothetical protein